VLGPGDRAVTPKLANVADIDQNHVFVALNRHDLFDCKGFDLLLGFLAELLDTFGDHVLISVSFVALVDG
jgi:hypothetical protein